MATSTASQVAQSQAYASLSTGNSASVPSFPPAGRQRGAPNGVSGRGGRAQADKSPAANMRETNTPDKHANDRLLFLLASFVGNVAHITVQSGDKFTGIFSAASFPKELGTSHQYVLKMVKRQTLLSQQSNGSVQDPEEYIGYGDDHVVVFDAKDIVDINVAGVITDKAQVKLTNGASASFRTDTDISGNLSGRERELQRWQPGGEAAQDLSFAEAGQTSWDQFEANERLYGLKTDYDETFYTTAIDRSAPSYNQRAAAAEKIAREIETSSTTNAHIAEERGQAAEAADGRDEEDRFSGVKRDLPLLASGQPNKYTPLAKRAPTGQSTVSGAPVDPAIISAQLARPEVATSSRKSPPAQASAGTLKKENVEPLVKNGTSQSGTEVLQKTMRDTPALPKDDRTANPSTPVPDQHQMPVPSSAQTAARAAPLPTMALPNTTANVERDVLKEFRDFAAREKMVMSERQRVTARKERDVKLNDLKKFASNFKLRTAVPTDMLGILAKDKQKQLEIIEKSQRQLTEQQDAVKLGASANAEQKVVRQTPDLSAAPSHAPGSAQTERQNGKTPQFTQPLQTSFPARGNRTSQPTAIPVLSPKAGPGNLGQRLLQQPQYRDRALQSFSGPSTGNTHGANSRNGSVSNTSAAARLNVQASEFRPNPTAVTFSPSAERASPVRPKKEPSVKVTNRTSFFNGKRPDRSEKKSIKDAFNPIAKMKAEPQTEKSTRDYANNGGIPQAYRTPPTWDTTEENKERSYVDMFEKPIAAGHSMSPGNVQMAHQLPFHLQGSHGMQSNHLQQFQGFPQPMHGKGGDHRFDDHRMQFSGSQSSHYSGPRGPQVIIPFNNQAMAHMQPQMGQAIAPFPYGGNPQQMHQLRQYPTQFMGTPNMAPVVMQPGGVPFMNVPMHPQHTPVFAPAQAHMIPAHVMGQHTPGGPSAYSSPRGAHLMMHQGSQQGHGPPQVYMNPGQYQGQLYAAQHPPQTPHMRGGIPMAHQHSFGGPQHYPGPQRQFSQMGNNFGMQPTQMDRGTSQQQHSPQVLLNGGERDESK